MLDTVGLLPDTPEYHLHLQVTNDSNTATISDDDSPSMGVTAPNLAQGIALDVLSTWRLWLVWKYPSGIYYPLAYIGWQANFYATAVGNNANKGPVNMIQVPHGVTAGTYIPDNETPDAMNTPIWNYNTQWVAA